jgi:hypothetical protein
MAERLVTARKRREEFGIAEIGERGVCVEVAGADVMEG